MGEGPFVVRDIEASRLPCVSPNGLDLLEEEIALQESSVLNKRKGKTKRPLPIEEIDAQRGIIPREMMVRARFEMGKTGDTFIHNTLIDSGACLTICRSGLFPMSASVKAHKKTRITDAQGHPIPGGHERVVANITLAVLKPDSSYALVTLRRVSMVSAHISNDIILGYPTLYAYGLAQIPALNCLIKVGDYNFTLGEQLRRRGLRHIVEQIEASVLQVGSTLSESANPPPLTPQTQQEGAMGGGGGIL